MHLTPIHKNYINHINLSARIMINAFWLFRLRTHSIFLIILLSSFSYSVHSKGLESRIDTLILELFSDSTQPGGVFLVSRKGEEIYKKAFGMANIELNVKMDIDNVFQIGSMTKQFTAVSILILEEQGKLRVNDPVSKFLPDFPNGKNITISHLLSHTSGIKNYTKMKSISEIATRTMNPEEVVNFFKDEPVKFSPGEKFKYNNSGYVLLGYLIELVSGESYEQFIQRNIFDKLGMKNSYYASDRVVIKNRAYGYHKKTDGFVNKKSISFSIPYAAGALMSTLDDMLKWQNALSSNLILNRESLAKAFTKKSLDNGTLINYGYGWHLKNMDGIQSREHGGSIFGFKSMGVYLPDSGIYVLGFSNCDCHSPTKIARALAKLVENDYSTKEFSLEN